MTATATRPRVTVVILNWNGREDTLACIASVLGSREVDFDVVVVDNGSEDGSQAAIRQAYPSLTLIETGRNLGYAEGNNVGLRHALQGDADYLLILNNDTIVAADMLHELVRASRALPRSVLGPLTFYHHDPDRVWWAGSRWNSAGCRLEHTGNGRDGPAVVPGAEPIATTYVVGSALFAPVALFREIGLLDAQYFLTHEETDWCYRARQAGWSCHCVPRAQMWHKVSVSMGGSGSPLQVYFYTRNALLWGERHLDRRDYLRLLGKTLRGVLAPSTGRNPGGGALRRLLWSAHGMLRRFSGRGAHPLSRARLLGLRDYAFRRFGDCPPEIRELNRRSREQRLATQAAKAADTATAAPGPNPAA